jgi:hypothetical protein
LDPISDPVAPATPWAWAFAGLFAVALVVILAWWTVANRTRRT